MVEYLLVLTSVTGRSWLGRLQEALTGEALVAAGLTAAVLLLAWVLVRR